MYEIIHELLPAMKFIAYALGISMLIPLLLVMGLFIAAWLDRG